MVTIQGWFCDITASVDGTFKGSNAHTEWTLTYKASCVKVATLWKLQCLHLQFNTVIESFFFPDKLLFQTCTVFCLKTYLEVDLNVLNIRILLYPSKRVTFGAHGLGCRSYSVKMFHLSSKMLLQLWTKVK